MERLLKDDAEADEVKYEIVEQKETAPDESDIGTPAASQYDAANSEADDMEEINMEGFDEDSLAADIERNLVELEDDDEDEDEDEEEEDEDEDEDEEHAEAGGEALLDDEGEMEEQDVIAERKKQRKALAEEVAELKTTIARKRNDLNAAANPIIMVRCMFMMKDA